MRIKTKNVSCLTADSKPVKLEVNGTMILPTLVLPGITFEGMGFKITHPDLAIKVSVVVPNVVAPL